MSASAHLVGEADFAALKAHDFDEEEYLGHRRNFGVFGMSKPAGQCDSMRPNAEFYALAAKRRRTNPNGLAVRVVVCTFACGGCAVQQ